MRTLTWQRSAAALALKKGEVKSNLGEREDARRLRKYTGEISGWP